MKALRLATRRGVLLIAFSGSCALGAFSRPLRAEGPSDKAAAAQTLFDKGRQLMGEGRIAEACPKLEESQRLDPASGTLLNLADCYERVGRIASAWLKFLEAAAASRAGGNVDREATARDRAALLAGKVPKVAIKVTSAATPGLLVRRDGEVLSRDQWGVALPADPGEHAITASAPGRLAWRTAVTLRVGDPPFTVVVPELAHTALEADTASAPIAAPPLVASSAVAPPPMRVEPALGTQRALAIAAAGAGGVGLVLGTAFALHSKSRHDEADRFCNGDACFEQRGVDLAEQAKTAGNVATVALVAGVAGVAGGALLWWTAPARDPAARVGIGFGTLQIAGTW